MHSPLYELLSLPMPVSFPKLFCSSPKTFSPNFTKCSAKVSVVSCGPSHCLIVTRGGSLWAWGSGTLGQVLYFHVFVDVLSDFVFLLAARLWRVHSATSWALEAFITW